MNKTTHLKQYIRLIMALILCAAMILPFIPTSAFAFSKSIGDAKNKKTSLEVTVKNRQFILKWKKLKDVAYYRIERCSEGGKFKFLKNYNGTTLTTRKYTKGKNYRFRIRPVTIIDKKHVYGQWYTSECKKCS